MITNLKDWKQTSIIKEAKTVIPTINDNLADDYYAYIRNKTLAIQKVMIDNGFTPTSDPTSFYYKGYYVGLESSNDGMTYLNAYIKKKNQGPGGPSASTAKTKSLQLFIERLKIKMERLISGKDQLK